MIIFTDDYQSHLNAEELANMEEAEGTFILHDLFSNRPDIVLPDGIEDPGFEIAPEFLPVTPAFTPLPPPAVTPTGGTETMWDKTIWQTSHLDRSTPAHVYSSLLPLDTSHTEQPQRPGGANLFASGYVSNTKRVTNLFLSISQRAEKGQEEFNIQVRRFANLKTQPGADRICSFYITTNHNRWAQGSGDVHTTLPTNSRFGIAATGAVSVQTLRTPVQSPAITTLLENGQFQSNGTAGAADDWSANHQPFPRNMGVHRVHNPPMPSIGGHGWLVRKHSFPAKANTAYLLTYVSNIHVTCAGAHNGAHIVLKEAPALFTFG